MAIVMTDDGVMGSAEQEAVDQLVDAGLPTLLVVNSL